MSDTVKDLIDKLPTGVLSPRTVSILLRCGAANQSADWLLTQVADLNAWLATGRSLGWVLGRKRQRDPRIPVIVYCRSLGRQGLREILQVFGSYLSED